MRPPDLSHPDFCGCPKPEGAWGGGGWHYAVSDGRMVSRGGNLILRGSIYAYEKCPAYWTAWHERREAEKARQRDALFEI